MKKRYLLIISYCIIIAMFFVGILSGSRAVTVMVEKAPFQRHHTIVIDAGHGGLDGGATSCTGKLESVLNLEIALRLRDLFHLLGYDTKMIRTDDISIYRKGETIAQKKVSDLQERVRIVNETENVLLLSIHQNNFTDSRYSGAQVFFGKEEGSEDLAKRLQSTLVSTLNPFSKRQCKKADGIYLMDRITGPGVLIECGFLSNPEEEAKLNTPEYQKKLCCVIVSTVTTFLSNT